MHQLDFGPGEFDLRNVPGIRVRGLCFLDGAGASSQERTRRKKDG